MLYALAIGAAFVWTPLSYALYVVVAALWLIPDRRIERLAGAGPDENRQPDANQVPDG